MAPKTTPISQNDPSDNPHGAFIDHPLALDERDPAHPHVTLGYYTEGILGGA